MTQTPPEIFDHKRWVRQRNKAAAGFSDFAFLKELATDRLIERLQIVRRQFVDILDYGCHSGQMAAALSEMPAPPTGFHLIQADHAAEFARLAQKNLSALPLRG